MNNHKDMSKIWSYALRRTLFLIMRVYLQRSPADEFVSHLWTKNVQKGNRIGSTWWPLRTSSCVSTTPPWWRVWTLWKKSNPLKSRIDGRRFKIETQSSLVSCTHFSLAKICNFFLLLLAGLILPYQSSELFKFSKTFHSSLKRLFDKLCSAVW